MSNVQIRKHTTADGHTLVQLTLNAPRVLNALSLDMIESLQAAIDDLHQDPQVVAILLDGVGERAFCAGGDVVSIYHALQADPDSDFPARYFAAEYRLDLSLHRLKVPLIGWGHGIVMGGGMGLLQACQFRVVSEDSRLAMPEVTIGLYPDVGASWFLNRLPPADARFIAMTACPLNARDAKGLDLADRFIANRYRHRLIDTLVAEPWSAPPATVIKRVLRRLEHASMADFDALQTPFLDHRPAIHASMDQDSLTEQVAAVLAMPGEAPWLQKARHTLAKGSPVTVCLTDALLDITRTRSLDEVFTLELSVSIQCCRHGEFQEGVRALLIDKDANPVWRYPSVADVDPTFIDALLTPVEVR